MLSARELFYGVSEPVWISKDEKKDDKKKGDDKNASTSTKGSGKADYPVYISASVPGYYPYYISPGYDLYSTNKDDGGKGSSDSSGTEKKKETKLELRVPICCSECEDSVKSSLYALKGVKNVECNTPRGKVTVVATTAAPADVLLECRKLFKKSKMWSDDD